jgi:putative membrane protein
MNMRKRTWIVMFTIIIGLATSGPAIADEGDYDHMEDHDMMGSWGMGYSLLWFILIVMIIAVIPIWLYTVLFPEGRQAMNLAPSSAQVLLDERYARGEIDTEEYLRMKHMMGR